MVGLARKKRQGKEGSQERAFYVPSGQQRICDLSRKSTLQLLCARHVQEDCLCCLVLTLIRAVSLFLPSLPSFFCSPVSFPPSLPCDLPLFVSFALACSLAASLHSSRASASVLFTLQDRWLSYLPPTILSLPPFLHLSPPSIATYPNEQANQQKQKSRRSGCIYNSGLQSGFLGCLCLPATKGRSTSWRSKPREQHTKWCQPGSQS